MSGPTAKQVEAGRRFALREAHQIAGAVAHYIIANADRWTIGDYARFFHAIGLRAKIVDEAERTAPITARQRYKRDHPWQGPNEHRLVKRLRPRGGRKAK